MYSVISKLLRRVPPGAANKKLIVFDLDGTLTETKSNMDRGMAALVGKLLEKKRAAIIGGGRYRQFRKQFTAKLSCPPKLLKKLFLFPTTSTSFYRYSGGWKKVYEKRFPRAEAKKIKRAFAQALREAGYVKPERTYGKIIEDRGSQITFSALGQDVVAVLGSRRGVALKKQWTKENTPLKLKIAKILRRLLPNVEVAAAGFTSVDVMKKGVDKSYGIREIAKHLHTPIRDMLFVGDALFAGGNDYAARKTGIACIAVKGPEETKKIIRQLL